MRLENNVEILGGLRHFEIIQVQLRERLLWWRCCQSLDELLDR